MSPNLYAPGVARAPLTITGFDLGGASKVEFLRNGVADTALSVSNLRVDTTGTSLTAELTVAANALSGARTVVVTAAGGTSETVAGEGNVLLIDAPPALTNPQADPARLSASGGNVTLRVTVSDDLGATSVWVEVTKPDGSKQIVTLSKATGKSAMVLSSPAKKARPSQARRNRNPLRQSTADTGAWEGTFTAPANATKDDQHYKVLFWAKDAANNQAQSEEVNFTVAGLDDSPVLTNPQVSPTNLPKEGGAVTLRVAVSDDKGVTSTWTEVTKPDGGKETINLTRKDGSETNGTWEGTFTAPSGAATQTQTYKVAFFAKDTNNNQAGPVNGQDFTVASQDAPPVISNPSLSRTTFSSKGGKVNISATITDDKGVASAWTLINSATRVDLKRKGKGSSYTAAWKAPKNNSTTSQTYTIALFARDTVGSEMGPVTVGAVMVQGKSGKRQDVLDDEDTPRIGTSSPLTLRLLSATGGKDGAATVFTFTLNRPAQITTRVLSPTGKVVWQSNSQQARAGLSSLLWDGKMQAGRVPSRGIYLFELTAFDKDGHAARAIRSVTVR